MTQAEENMVKFVSEIPGASFVRSNPRNDYKNHHEYQVRNADGSKWCWVWMPDREIGFGFQVMVDQGDLWTWKFAVDIVKEKLKDEPNAE